ncbi:MAG: thiol reductant ABC exporter subunit CydC [Burkholderiaceae bacterium]|nr:thiol reductant ABC exporter subunit CydC [Burkholderiaceae bacterium]
MSVRRLMSPLYLNRWRHVAAALGLAVLTVTAGIGLLGVSGWFLSGAALAASLLSFNLFVPSALIRILSFLRIGSRYAERIAGHALTLRLLADLRVQVFAAVMRQTPARLMRLRQGDAVAALTGDIDTLDSVFLLVLVPLCTALMAGLAFAGVWAAFAPWAAAVMGAATLLVAAVLPWGVMRLAYAAGWRIQHATAHTRDELLGVVHGHADLLALAAVGAAQARYDRACAAHAQARCRLAGIAAGGQAILQMIAGGSVLGVVALGLYAWQAGTLAGPVLAGLVLATLGVFELAAAIVRGAVKWGTAAGAAQRLQQVMDVSVEADVDAGGYADVLQPTANVRSSSAIECRGLVLTYPGRGIVLNDVSLFIESGGRVALLGASGSGKTTVLHALAGLHAPAAGVLSVGGRDRTMWTARSGHEHVAILSQDAPVFLGTVRTNLLIAQPQADDARLWTALDAARLGDFVRRLPQGLDTWTGEGGWSLSAGQARRLCLARVLLCDARIWLLDEPTAGLDEDNERAFLAALAQCADGRTVVVATHAVLPAFAVDRVLRLVAGQLIEDVAGWAPRRAA